VKKNRLLYISNWVALLYFPSVIFYIVSLFEGEDPKWGSFNALTIVALLIFRSFLIYLGLKVGWKAYKNNQRWWTLISIVLYLLGVIMNLNSGLILIPSFILNGIAFSQQTKQFYKDKSSEAQLLP